GEGLEEAHPRPHRGRAPPSSLLFVARQCPRAGRRVHGARHSRPPRRGHRRGGHRVALPRRAGPGDAERDTPGRRGSRRALPRRARPVRAGLVPPAPRASPLEHSRDGPQPGDLGGHALPLSPAPRSPTAERVVRGETGRAAPASVTHVSRDALHNLCLADPVWCERYEGWTELGHGGSASVVRTHGKALEEDLALKIFPRLTADEWKRFQDEVRHALRLTSPYIVRTYSAFPRGSFAWIELELVDGPNLRQELERRAAEGRAFSLEEALDIGIAIAHALVAAHEAGIVHRDVKPANILLPRDGLPVAKLGDFGISQLAGAARVTKTGLLVGTPQFASPEIIAGQRGGSASDVYSFTL